MAQKKNKEEDGIAAIRYLQKMVGIAESEDEARKGWASMSPEDRQQTMEMYKMFHNDEVDAK
jgi:hypothetical protein